MVFSFSLFSRLLSWSGRKVRLWTLLSVHIVYHIFAYLSTPVFQKTPPPMVTSTKIHAYWTAFSLPYPLDSFCKIVYNNVDYHNV